LNLSHVFRTGDKVMSATSYMFPVPVPSS